MRSLQIGTDLTQRIHQMSFGAAVNGNENVHFQLPAPTATTVDLLLYNNHQVTKLPLKKCGEGRFELFTEQATAGSTYKFLIDDKIAVPDPASRCQVDTVHGPSQVIDPLSYTWLASNWHGKVWEESIIYELHIGTFTKEGTFAALEEKLDYLINLGITAIELMPIADFPGQRNWGYDGVLFFTSANRYGSPNQLKHLIDLCHQKGLMVFLDVVYNHFGPEGNYLHAYANNFFNEHHKTPWGAALNYDSPNSLLFRDFIVSNALYWLNEFYFDGLRLDAVHAINDTSANHIVMDICQAVAAGPGIDRHIHIILENDNNSVNFLQRDLAGKHVHATAQWNDDIHHVFHVIATGEKEGYYSDYASNMQIPGESALSKLGKALSAGFVYQGEASPFRNGEHRGEPSKHLPTTAFISFLQNHDQIGNRAFGERLYKIADQNKLKALTAIFLLAPQIPMLFMGEEWAASTPFLYFCDLGPDLAPLVTAGRRAEFKHFSIFKDEQKRKSIPDPCAIDTYQVSILNWEEKEQGEHAQFLSCYQDLLALRQQNIIPLLGKLKSGSGEYNVLADNLLYVSWLLEDGRCLKLIAHLDDKIITFNSTFIFPKTAKILFQHPVDCSQKLTSGTVPPHSVVWYLA